MSETARAHIFVEGKVQGVFFREKTRKKAEEIEVTGWVKNLPDGRVEAVFEGGKEKVQNLIEWSKRGPFFAKVDNVEIHWEEYQGEFKNFEVR